MDLDGESVAARGLRRYVRLVSEAIGIGSEASTIQFDDPVSVYLPLDRCSPDHHDHDLALLWDERHGWALAEETGGGADLRVLGYLGSDLLADPCTVATFVERACRGGGFGHSVPPVCRSTGLTGLLASYAEPIHAAPWLFRPAVRRAAAAAPAMT